MKEVACHLAAHILGHSGGKESGFSAHGMIAEVSNHLINLTCADNGTGVASDIIEGRRNRQVRQSWEKVQGAYGLVA